MPNLTRQLINNLNEAWVDVLGTGEAAAAVLGGAGSRPEDVTGGEDNGGDPEAFGENEPAFTLPRVSQEDPPGHGDGILDPEGHRLNVTDVGGGINLFQTPINEHNADPMPALGANNMAATTNTNPFFTADTVVTNNTSTPKINTNNAHRTNPTETGQNTITQPQLLPGSITHAAQTAAAEGYKRFFAELAHQGIHEDGNGRRKEFWEQVLSCHTIKVFMFMKPNNPFIQLTHSIARYSGDVLHPDEHTGDVVGFIGGREGGQEPSAIKIESSYLQTWRAVTIPENILTYMGPHFNNGNVSLYQLNPAEPPAQVNVPKLCLLPSFLVQWATAAD